MALCPVCHTPGAYVGFTVVECRNPECEHFQPFREPVCPVCRQSGHSAEAHSALGELDSSLDSGDRLPNLAGSAGCSPGKNDPVAGDPT